MSEFKNLGILVWFTVPELHIGLDTVKEKLTALGLTTKKFKETSPHLALSRAVREFHDIRNHQLGRRIGIQETTDGSYFCVSVVDEKADEAAATLSYQQSTNAKVNVKTGELEVTGPLANELRTFYQIYRESICDEDVRLWLYEILREVKASPKRTTGGIYFVPNQYAPQILKVGEFLAQLTTGAKLYYDKIWVEAGEEGNNERTNIWISAEEALAAQVEVIVEQVVKVQSRASSVTAKQQDLQEIRDTMKLYEDILGKEAKTEKLLTKMAEAEQVIAGKLAELQATVEAAEVAVKATAEPARLRLPDAVTKVLQDGGNQPMTPAEICQKAIDAGIYQPRGENPVSSVYSTLVTNLKFKRAKRGYYVLSDFNG